MNSKLDRFVQGAGSTVLVTGASGFIGRRLVRKLFETGASVRTFSRGGDPSQFDRVLHFSGDVVDSASVRSALNGVETIFHLAGFGSPSTPYEYATEMYRINAAGTISMLSAAQDAGVRRVIVTSSASVYGHLDASSISEDVALEPSSPYGLTKLAQEQACRMYSREFGIETVVLRLFNVYGPGEDMTEANRKLIPSVVRRVQRNLPVQVYGDGNQTRDFIHVDDVVAAILRSAEIEVDGHLTLNIGTGIGTPIGHVIQELGNILGNRPVLDHQPLRSRETIHSVADVRLARANAIQASIPLEEGILTILDNEG